MTDAFFEPGGDLYVGTAATGGPWDPRRSMHFGPPAALLARAIDAEPTDSPKRLLRATFEILRPVPIGPVRVDSRIVRPGRRVDLVEAVLTDREGTELALCRAWRIRTATIDVPAGGVASGAPPGPEHGGHRAFFAVDADVHYGTSVETRFLSGGFLDHGPAQVWMRMRIPLVAGEAPSPVTRVLIVADSGNGVSAIADPTEVVFVNTDLTVHLHRHPIGEWICLEAETVIDGQGSGLATSHLSDATGGIGTSLQTLFVQPRS
ncbi:thioesterase family protein [soil metagenome]